ncbi:MAG: aldehyde dehydrogenase family protein [Terriglobia bacterium]
MAQSFDHSRRWGHGLRGSHRNFWLLLSSGQICLNTQRIIIQRKTGGEFLTKVRYATKTLPSGDRRTPRPSSDQRLDASVV